MTIWKPCSLAARITLGQALGGMLLRCFQAAAVGYSVSVSEANAEMLGHRSIISAKLFILYLYVSHYPLSMPNA